ncbi:MAG: ABC transporter permease [Spirochaetota bacterium]
MIEVCCVRLSSRFLHVWRRNLMVYRKTWKISFIPPILEPLLYLFAFGTGLGSLVGKIDMNGTSISYIQFIAPALIAINMMYNAFFENTYSSFVRMYYQKTFDAQLATPLSIEEVITGEIFWGATKSTMATILMLGIISLFGIIKYPSGLLLLPLSFLGGMALGSIAMFFTAIVPSIDTFNLPMFLFVTPMFLFSGTFFPLQNLPLWAQRIANLFPLTHLVNLSRFFSIDIPDPGIFLSLSYLFLFTLLFFTLALSMMRRRLIK